MRPRRARAARQITLLFVGGLIVSAILLGCIAYVAGRGAIAEQIDARIETEMGSLRHLKKYSGTAALLKAIEKSEERGGGGFDYILMDPAGRRLFGEPGDPALAAGWHDIPLDDDRGQQVPVRALTAEVDGLRLTVATNMSPAAALLRTTAILFAVALLVLIALAVGCGLLFERALRSRLDLMNRTAVAIIAGRLESRIELSGHGDELDQLATTFNSMFSRIEALIGNLRQVSSDVAHELRTPITHLQNRLEQALEQLPPGSIGYETVDAAIDDSERILSLFSALLRISEVEAGTVRRYFRPFDFSQQATMIVDSYGAVAEDRGCRLLSTIAPDIVLEGDPELLSQAMTNLIENAINHNPAGTNVTVAVDRYDDEIVLTVTDDGAGIGAADREAALRRFVRLGGSRSQSRHGLGLPLVQAIARLHQGEIELADARPGLRAIVRLRCSHAGAAPVRH